MESSFNFDHVASGSVQYVPSAMSNALIFASSETGKEKEKEKEKVKEKKVDSEKEEKAKDEDKEMKK